MLELRGAPALSPFRSEKLFGQLTNAVEGVQAIGDLRLLADMRSAIAAANAISYSASVDLQLLAEMRSEGVAATVITPALASPYPTGNPALPSGHTISPILPAAPQPPVLAEQLATLAGLHQNGDLTTAEFTHAKRAALLAATAATSSAARTITTRSPAA